MERRIGEILRKARARRDIDLEEVRAATRIRLKYLHAIEAEDWDTLPEAVYTRAFIRTYASFLGLDGERLAAEFRGGAAAPGTAARAEPGSESGARRRREGARGRALPASWVAVAGVLLVAVLAIVALPLGGGGEGDSPPSPAPRASSQVGAPESTAGSPPRPAGITLRLTASAEVWVCLLDGAGRQLVAGRILEAGAEEGPFRSGKFTVSFGNGEIEMLVDGREADIPATSSPIGYSVDASGGLTPLSESERPTCT